ncbi:MAG TPA: thiamine pyrophosphate-dependent dehydrogenase E1 component subunit alpha, partial [Verrucomicrobiae bacterium]|nr:thiamine pyrophosphate-dependent dehydrogenase E1 component subunit alpha [Verrucomicrobiae bacterium]
MLQLVEASSASGAARNARSDDDAVARREYLTAFRWMLLARALDDKLASLYRAGKIHGGVFLGRGQEALSVATGLALRQGDVFAPLIRDGAGRLAFGETVVEALQSCLGSPHGPMRGRDGNVHRGRPKDGYLPMVSHLGATIAVVNGVLLARRMQGKTGIVGATCIGEGGTSTGSFHEAVNQAAVERLPLVIVIADNQYAYSTPNSRQYACEHLVERAAGYGVGGHTVDGTDLSACLATLSAAVAKARAGGGPQMIVANLLRLCGHGEHDDSSYIDPKLKNSHIGRDCNVVAEEHILRRGWADPAVIERTRAEIAREIDESLAAVQREGAPDPFR